MARAHLLFGIVVFVIFLVTGQFMDGSFPDKETVSAEFRLLMRSRHIYILLSSLTHIVLGLYLRLDDRAWRRGLQLFGSSLLALGSLVLVWAFFYETYTTGHFSEASRSGLYLTLAGTAFHLFSRFR